ncbi:MAG: hypothetical protein R3B55_02850 [Candidatus Paceibacterota bacterium]
MERNPNMRFDEKREFSSTEESILKFFIEKGDETINFDTLEEAKSKVDEINAKYGDISFVAEDRGKFSVKFNEAHLGAGFKKEKIEEESEVEKSV